MIATLRDAILLVQMKQCLAFICIVWFYSKITPIFDNLVRLGTHHHQLLLFIAQDTYSMVNDVNGPKIGYNHIDNQMLDRLTEPTSSTSFRCQENCCEGLRVTLFTLMLHTYLVQKRFTHSISDHQETFSPFQDLTVCSIRFHP